VISILTRIDRESKNCIEDLILCIAAQNHEDFEWIMLVRPSFHSEVSWLRSIIESYEQLQIKTKIIECHSDSRGELLNIGLKSAKGKYLVVVDDDDLVTANFVEVFDLFTGPSLSQNNNIALRTIGAKKSYEEIAGPQKFLAATSRATFPFDQKFDLLAHSKRNSTPCCAVAWPITLMKTENIKWDEELKVVEDWDFILKIAPYVEFFDLPVSTSIYRVFDKASRSQTIEGINTWEQSERIVRKRTKKSLSNIKSIRNTPTKIHLKIRVEALAFSRIDLFRKSKTFYRLARLIYHTFWKKDN
jgi:glycosyltransferase involved in cell wall biosynthesis